MAAKNKAKRRQSVERNVPIPDIRETFALHLKASQLLDALLEEVRELQAVGKIREARRAFKHAEEIQQNLAALEDGCRHPSKSRDRRFV